MIHIRIVDAPMVGRVEGAPVLRVARPRDRTETLADGGRDVILIFRPGHRGRLEDLLRLPLHVCRELPVPRLRGVVQHPIPSTEFVHEASHAWLHRRDLVDSQCPVFGRGSHARTWNRALLHGGGNGDRVKDVSGFPFASRCLPDPRFDLVYAAPGDRDPPIRNVILTSRTRLERTWSGA